MRIGDPDRRLMALRLTYRQQLALALELSKQNGTQETAAPTTSPRRKVVNTEKTTPVQSGVRSRLARKPKRPRNPPRGGDDSKSLTTETPPLAPAPARKLLQPRTISLFCRADLMKVLRRHVKIDEHETPRPKRRRSSQNSANAAAIAEAMSRSMEDQ